MRGKEQMEQGAGRLWGITPACAGKSLADEYPDQAARGSPPRVRGKVSASGVYVLSAGITPACAGKSVAALSFLPFGEGSPPRVRGKVRPPTASFQLSGITPACAGKSRCRSRPGNTGWDHPRVCGEKRGPCPRPAPRVRGKGIQPGNHRVAMGITPACAGKSGTPRAYQPRPKDHPRVCGEKTWTPYKPYMIQGSPPRVRGKEHRTKKVLCFFWITPACAGKSKMVKCWWLTHWDHPRVCGEKTKKIP